VERDDKTADDERLAARHKRLKRLHMWREKVSGRRTWGKKEGCGGGDGQ